MALDVASSSSDVDMRPKAKKGSVIDSRHDCRFQNTEDVNDVAGLGGLGSGRIAAIFSDDHPVASVIFTTLGVEARFKF